VSSLIGLFDLDRSLDWSKGSFTVCCGVSKASFVARTPPALSKTPLSLVVLLNSNSSSSRNFGGFPQVGFATLVSYRCDMIKSGQIDM
jgi:hypothetical protein